MKNLTKESILRKLISILLIIATVLPYFPMNVFAVESENDIENKVTFNIAWKDGSETEEGTTEDSFVLTYDLAFNEVPTGFQNVTLEVETNKVKNAKDEVIASNISSKGNGYGTLYFGNINTGETRSGDIGIRFGNKDEELEREVYVTLRGEYKDPVTGEICQIEKTINKGQENEEVKPLQKILKATVTPATKTTNYYTNLEWKPKNSIYDSYGPTYYVSKAPITNGWYSKQITASYPIHIQSELHTQKLDLNVIINRTTTGESKMSQGVEIDWGGLKEVFGEPTQTELEDGSIKYTFSKEVDASESSLENTFSIDNEYIISITYETNHTNPVEYEDAETNTLINFFAELTGTGFVKEQVYGQEEEIKKVTSTKKTIEDVKSLGLAEYTPGDHSWKSYRYTNNSSIYINNNDLINIKNGNNIDLITETFIDRQAGGTKEISNGTLSYIEPIISYISDEGLYVSKELNNNQIRVKSVEAYAESTGDSTIKFNTDSIDLDAGQSYTFNGGTNVNAFSIVMEDMLNKEHGFYTTFTLNSSELGLSETEIDNILGITFEMSASGQWCYGGNTVYFKNVNQAQIKYANFDMEIDNWDTTLDSVNSYENNKITLTMSRPDGWQDYEGVSNENPIFYIKLPNAFKYQIDLEKDIKLSGGNNEIQIDYENIYYIIIEGERHLVIPCIGTYNSNDGNEASITINVKKKTTKYVPSVYKVDAFMLTDNENYHSTTDAINNIYELTKLDETIPAKVMVKSASCAVTGSSRLIATTKVTIDDEINKEYGNMDANVIEEGEKEYPKIVSSNSVITYKSGISVYDKQINNISILSRLPFANNTQIYSDEKLISDGYVLPYTNENDFMNIKGNGINGIQKGEEVNQITLQNITIKGVYKSKDEDGYVEKISPDKYTIYYTTDEKANFDSDSSVFIEYVEGQSDLSQAKNIKVVVDDSVDVKSGEEIYFEYTATMPDEAGMVGASSSVKYTNKINSEVEKLDAPAVYVINGNTDGQITVIKKFEDYAVGSAPSGVSLSGIEFKLYYYEGREKKFLTDSSGNDIVATTDNKGYATFSNVPYGEYYLYEVTQFENYSGIEGSGYINLDENENKEIIVVNKLKRGSISVKKEWDDAKDSQGKVTFKITRKVRDDSDLEYNAMVTTNEDDIAIFEKVPYGEYVITEINVTDGWCAEQVEKEVTVDSEDVMVEASFENIPIKGNLKIVKTVDEDDTVNGLTFHITGRGKIIYEKLDGNFINTDLDLIVKIGETDPEITINDGEVTTQDITVVKSSDNKTATITINNVYAGKYNVEEIDIPTLPGSSVTKFVTTSPSGEITYNGQELTLSMVNKWRTGTLRVIKTAEPGVELNQFKVRVTSEETLYGTKYDKVFDIPENGILTVSGLYLGEYNVTEVESDYFNAKYGEEKETTPAKVEIKDSTVSSVQIYNENAYGYVKILKTLEGKDATETKGIKFRLYGKDTTGANVDETKEITETVEYNGKTYGVVVFGPVQAGGEYELVELEETVPDYFIASEPMAVEVTKHYTEENPYIIKIDNKRGIGNLEISTKTIPEGGELSPIVYDVTEVIIEENGKINKIGGATRLNATSGHASINNLNAGMYIVELVEVPSGYEKDYPQIVEVPVDETAYVEFEIEKLEILDSGLTIEKEILTKSGSVATSEDFEKAKINENESFEAIITSEDKTRVYYSFFNQNNPGKIKGLSQGTYEIEEIFKPKYLTTKYLMKNGDDYEEIVAVDGKYLFTVINPEDKITIKIVNTINTEFGFGGQDTIDNFSKTTVEQVNKTTRTIFLISDEDGAVVSGAKFKLFDANGNEVKISFEDNTYVVGSDKKLIVYGLPVGNYTIRAVSVPDGYEKPEDKAFTVFNNATMYTRVEIWKTKPRGKTLTLSTKYVDENGEKQYTPRSKYKILDKSTGKVLRFEKNSAGNYVRSKSATATDTISLRKGSVVVSGIEVGEYQLGLVDLTETYGVINTEPEVLNITDGSVIDKEVIVKERSSFVKADVNSVNIMAIRETGEVMVYPSSYWISTINQNRVINVDTSDYEMMSISKLYPNLEGVKAIDCAITDDEGYFAIVDIDGKVWTNYYGYEINSLDASNAVCISDLPDNPLNGVKIEKVYMNNYSSIDEIYAIDENGKVWRWGAYSNSIDSRTSCKTPKCISDDTILKDKKIVQIASSNSSATSMAIDSDGNLYAWGYDSNGNSGIMDSTIKDSNGTILEPVCVTTSEGTNLKDVKIKFIEVGYATTYFIDYDGNLWVCGKNSNGLLGINSTDTYYQENNPICLTKLENNPLYNKQIENVSCYYNYTVNAIDSDGKVWGWGYANRTYALGTEDYSTVYEPRCISDLENNYLDEVKIKNITTDNGGAIAVDENGDLWYWGGEYPPVGFETYCVLPNRINASTNAYFDLFEVNDIDVSSDSSAIILDRAGRLWKTSESGLTDLSSKEIYAEFEDITIADYSSSDADSYDVRNIAVVGTNGELWTMGEINLPYIYLKEGGNNTGYRKDKCIEPLCITSIEGNVLYNKKIVSADVGASTNSNSAIAVIDEDGKLYTAGGKYSYNLGYTPGVDMDYMVPFECLNDKYENLSNVKFRKVVVNDDETMIALDENGNIWSWGIKNSTALGVISLLSDYQSAGGYDCIAPTKLSIPNDAKIVDVAIYSNDGIALDENGNVYIWGNSSYYQTSSSQTPVLVDASQTGFAGKRIIKVGIGNNYRVVMDDSGEIFTYGTGSHITNKSLTQAYTVVAKDFYTGANTIMIKDVENDIWVVGEHSQLGQFTKISTSTSPAPPSGSTTTSTTTTSGAAYRMTNIVPNYLYDLTIDRVIDGNTISIKNGEADSVKIISTSGSVLRTTNINKISEVINTDLYTVIIDTNKNMYFKQVDGTTIKTINKKIKVDKVIDGGTTLYIIDENGKLYRYTTTTINPVQITGFDENAKIVNVLKGNADPLYAQDDAGSLWKITDNTPAKIEGYTGGNIKEIYNVRDNTSRIDTCILDENKTLWRCDGEPVAILENVEKVQVVKDNKGTGVFVALDSDGNLYTWGLEYNYYRGYCKLGSTDSYTGAYKDNGQVLNLSQYIGKVKMFKFKDYSSKMFGNYCSASSIVAVTESNDIYGCVPGELPFKAVTTKTWGNIVNEFGEYFIDENGNAISMTLNLGSGSSKSTLSVAITQTFEEYTQEDGYIKYANGDIGIWKSSGSQYVRYTDIAQLKITSIGTDGTFTGMVLGTDGNLYVYTDGVKKCLTDQASYADTLTRGFKLIRDSKYNN